MRFGFFAFTLKFSFVLLLLFALSAQAQRSDYEREKRWADEILPGLLVGEPVWLGGSRKFLGLYVERTESKTAILLLHGAGIHPDYGLTGNLRMSLADAGYATLSIQMPILASDASPDRYRFLFSESTARIATAVSWLRGKGYRRIALVSHSMGARMANHYIAAYPKAPLVAWVALSISGGGFEPFPAPKFPVFDVYAEKDREEVLSTATRRAAVLRNLRGSNQTLVYRTDHFYTGREKELVSLIELLLERKKKSD